MTSRLARAAALLAVACALSGCARITSDNTFSDHNTVSQDTVLALAPAAAEQLDIDLDTLTADSFNQLEGGVLPGVDPAKVTVEDYRDGEIRGIRVIARDLTLDEFNAASTGAQSTAEDLDGATGADADSGLGSAPGVGTPMTVARDGNHYVITIPADPSRDISGMRGASSVGVIASAITFELRFTFPGPVTSASVGEVHGKTVVIGLEDLLTAEEITIRGEATDAIAWTPIARWAALALLALAIVGGAAWLVARAKRKQRPRGLAPIPDPGPHGRTPPDSTTAP